MSDFQRNEKVRVKIDAIDVKNYYYNAFFCCDSEVQDGYCIVDIFDNNFSAPGIKVKLCNVKKGWKEELDIKCDETKKVKEYLKDIKLKFIIYSGVPNPSELYKKELNEIEYIEKYIDKVDYLLCIKD